MFLTCGQNSCVGSLTQSTDALFVYLFPSKKIFGIIATDNADDVFIEGIMFRNAKDNIVHVDPGVKNAKLVEFEIYGSYVPGGEKTSIDGLIVTAPDSSLQILRGKFNWNFATVLYNRGNTVVYDSQFKANRNRRAESKVRFLFWYLDE